MARTPQWESLEMAAGDPSPKWPMPTVKPKFALWSVGGGRPFGCELNKCERWHAGIDLTGAIGGSLVVAPEAGIVAAVDRGWSKGSKAVFLRTDSGLFLVLGGTILGSGKEFDLKKGQRVRKGDSLGRVLGSYGMIHFETYVADGRQANSPWRKDKGPPKGLLNPTNYVERMVGDRISLLRTVQRQEALAALGYFVGDVDAAWAAASRTALRAAQTALGVEADGKWGPNTETVIVAALAKVEDKSGGESPAKGDTPSNDNRAGGPSTSTDWRWLAAAGATVAVGVAAGVLWRRSQRSKAAVARSEGMQS